MQKNMVSAKRISKIVEVSEEEIINKSLISFIEREIRLAEVDIADNVVAVGVQAKVIKRIKE